MTNIYHITTALTTHTQELFKQGAQAFCFYGGRIIQLIQQKPHQKPQNNQITLDRLPPFRTIISTLSRTYANGVKNDIKDQPIAIHYDQKKIELSLLSGICVGASILILNYALAKTLQYSLNPFALTAWTVMACVIHLFKNCKVRAIIDNSIESPRRIEESQDQLVHYQNQIIQLKQSVVILQTEKESLISKEREANRRSEECKEKLEQLSLNLKQVQKASESDLKDHKVELSKAEAKINELKGQLQSPNTHEGKLKQKIHILEQKHQEMLYKASLAEEENSELKKRIEELQHEAVPLRLEQLGAQQKANAEKLHLEQQIKASQIILCEAIGQTQKLRVILQEPQEYGQTEIEYLKKRCRKLQIELEEARMENQLLRTYSISSTR